MKKPEKGIKETDTFAMEFQSTTWDTNFKTLFYVFKSLNILYSYPSDFNGKTGSFVAVQDKWFKEISDARPDFGAQPNRGEIDMTSHLKIDKAIKENK